MVTTAQLESGRTARAEAAARAFANRLRLDILWTIVQGAKGGCSAGALGEAIGQSQPLTSYHLGILRRSGVVDTTRQAQTVLYHLPLGEAKADAVESIMDALDELAR